MGDPNEDHLDQERDVTPPHVPTRHRRGVLIGTTTIFVVLGLQVAIPLIAFLKPPPQKLGFQMYSALGGVTATVVTSEENEVAYAIDALVAKNRPEIDWLRRLPEAICAAEPEAKVVRVQQSGATRSVECD